MLPPTFNKSSIQERWKYLLVQQQTVKIFDKFSLPHFVKLSLEYFFRWCIRLARGLRLCAPVFPHLWDGERDADRLRSWRQVGDSTSFWKRIFPGKCSPTSSKFQLNLLVTIVSFYFYKLLSILLTAYDVATRSSVGFVPLSSPWFEIGFLSPIAHHHYRRSTTGTGGCQQAYRAFGQSRFIDARRYTKLVDYTSFLFADLTVCFDFQVTGWLKHLQWLIWAQ